MVRYFGGGRRAWGAGGFPRVGDAFVKYEYFRTMKADLFIFRPQKNIS
jgi:hypothetical protein